MAGAIERYSAVADSLPPFRYNNFLYSGPLVRDSGWTFMS
jgi:hypothetical protein